MGTEADPALGLYHADDHLHHHGMLTSVFPSHSLIPPQGFGYHAILNHSQDAFVFLYCLANFFQNFGPNTTTFVIPGEAFPTRYRSTAHGISAASGKLGAVVAQVGFARLKDIGGTNQVGLRANDLCFWGG